MLVAQATNAWFLTFGSDVGIASTIGRLREARGSSFPMIGICDYKHMKYSEFIQFTKLEMDAKSGSGGGGGSNSMDSPAKQPKTKNELWDEVEARATMKVSERKSGNCTTILVHIPTTLSIQSAKLTFFHSIRLLGAVQ